MMILNRWKWSESHSVMSASLWPHGLHNPWNSPGQNTGVGSRSHLQGIFPTQGSNPGLLHFAGGFFTSRATIFTSHISLLFCSLSKAHVCLSYHFKMWICILALPFPNCAMWRSPATSLYLGFPIFSRTPTLCMVGCADERHGCILAACEDFRQIASFPFRPFLVRNGNLGDSGRWVSWRVESGEMLQTDSV